MQLRAVVHRSLLLAVIAMGLFWKSAAGAQRTPEARVRAFVADYSRVHRESRKIIDAGDFDAWRKVIARLDSTHFVAGARSGLDDSMSSDPDHDPDVERIASSEIRDDTAVVETQAPDSVLTRYFEYELRLVTGDWRIVRLRSYLDSREAPFMSPQERSQFQDPKVHPFRPLPPGEADLDGDAMFAAGRSVQVGERRGTLEVRRVGALNVTTGIIVVGDLGYDARTLAALGRRVAPGRHPVDVSIAFGRVAAVRVSFSGTPVAQWYPADMGSEGGHVVGVDAGNVSISDVSALLPITARHKEKQFERFAESGDAAAVLMLTLANPDDCVIASSGYGDGAYPVYWGVDADGTPVALLVDMMVLPGPGSVAVD